MPAGPIWDHFIIHSFSPSHPNPIRKLSRSSLFSQRVCSLQTYFPISLYSHIRTAQSSSLGNWRKGVETLPIPIFCLKENFTQHYPRQSCWWLNFKKSRLDLWPFVLFQSVSIRPASWTLRTLARAGLPPSLARPRLYFPLFIWTPPEILSLGSPIPRVDKQPGSVPSNCTLVATQFLHFILY